LYPFYVLRDQIRRELVYCPFQFNKRGQLFIRMDNKTLSVVAVRVCNKDGLSARIDR
jgi:hypothetical protein